MAYCRIMAQESESRSLDKVIVRLPDGMRDRIKAAAEANNRSMNAEIVATLEEAYPAPGDAMDLEAAQKLFTAVLSADNYDDMQRLAKEANKELMSPHISGPRAMIRIEFPTDGSRAPTLVIHPYRTTHTDKD